jgi:hypothetical protein
MLEKQIGHRLGRDIVIGVEAELSVLAACAASVKASAVGPNGSRPRVPKVAPTRGTPSDPLSYRQHVAEASFSVPAHDYARRGTSACRRARLMTLWS